MFLELDENMLFLVVLGHNSRTTHRTSFQSTEHSRRINPRSPVQKPQVVLLTIPNDVLIN